MLREIHPNTLWEYEEPFSLLCIPIGARMVIVRLAGGPHEGELWVYSPFEVSDEVARTIKNLGTVRSIVVSTPMHTTQVVPFVQRFPQAELWVIPEAQSKVKVEGQHALNAVPEAWRADFDALRFDASLLLKEWVFLHRATRTLIVTDLAMNVPQPTQPLPALGAKLAGIGGKCGLSRLEKTSIILALGQHAKARRQISTILKWDFDRLIMAHGDIVETGGKAALRVAYRWLLHS